MPEFPPVQEWTERRLVELGSAYWQSSTLHAAVSLGIFGRLAGRRLDAGQLAEELSCDGRALAMLLRALAAMGLLEQNEEGFSCSEFSARRLDPASEGYLGDILLHHHHLVPSWFRLDSAVRHGKPADRSHEFSDAEWRSAFLRGMRNLAQLTAGPIVSAIPLAGSQRLLDVGGGPGTYAGWFCRHNPELRADVFDLPASRPFFEETLEGMGLADRVGFLPGDFHVDPFPTGYDAAWLSHILHGEDPERSARLVAKAAASLRPGGLLLIHEFILDDAGPGPLFPALFALNMLLQTEGGQSYAEGELRAMLELAGLGEIRRLPLPGGPSGVLLGVRH